MQFQKVGLVVTAFQMVGAIHYAQRRYPPFSWVVRGWFEDKQVVMRSGEFRKTFGRSGAGTPTSTEGVLS